MTMSVRRIRLAEWREVRELRLRALQDPNAHIAFLHSHEEAAREPDSFWQERAAGSALGDDAAQFVAIGPNERWTGSATVIVQAAGTLDEFGQPRPADRAIVVGVFVDPDARASGTIDALLAHCAEWAATLGFERLFLDVHVDNARAIAAYARCGFVETGVTFVDVIGAEQEMVLSIEE